MMTAEIGNVLVFTTDNRGSTPDELAERAINRILHITTREELKRVLTKYFVEAQESKLRDVKIQLVQEGFADAAARLGG